MFILTHSMDYEIMLSILMAQPAENRPLIQLTKVDKGGSATTPLVISTEFADGDRGCKIVFRSYDKLGKPATYETGSFKDNGNASGVKDKHDICVSTAAGCTRNCGFCAVPKAELGFERLLTSTEIEAQVTSTISLRNKDNALPNVVGLMGNGEPPDNYKNVIPALQHLFEQHVPIDRVTISTIGESSKGINALADAFAESDIPVKLQFSLHVANNAKRREIIPGKRTIEEIMYDVDRYAEVTGQPVKFNVVLMETDTFTNASVEDAIALASLLQQPSFFSGKPIARRLKMSAYNPIPGLPFRAPNQETRDLFVKTLRDHGVSEIKTFKGSGIDIDSENGTGGFACGQLRATTRRAVDQSEAQK